MKFTYVGRHADVLANGRPLAPEDVVSLNSEEQKANAAKIDDGRLLPHGPVDKKGK